MEALSGFFQEPGWEAFGLCGQLIFGSRFLYQWFASERAGRSVVPEAFWWLSVTGSTMIMIYAVHKSSFAFMIPTFTGVPVYLRNIVLLHREKKNPAAKNVRG